jgi:outer membrane protein OmpA-like peptidoglycan-associated protein
MRVKCLVPFPAILTLCGTTFSQNLIPNPGFEEHDKCMGFNTMIKEWKMPTGKYYHYLSDCPVGKSQYSGEEFNAPYRGKCFAGICLYPAETREYITVPLKENLKAGEEYIFSGYISLAAEKHTNYQNFSNFEVAFTTKEYRVQNPSFIFLEPQLHIPITFAQREMEWFYMSGKFRAKGGESYLLMGDFLSEVAIGAQMEEYVSLSEEEKVKYLKKNRSFEVALEEFNSFLTNTTKSYSIRCYLDELCLMPASDTLKGLCNYPVKKVTPPAPPIEKPKPIIIENIFFETGKSNLLPKSFKSLDSLANWLTTNPAVEIQITGHTDNRGNEKENSKLSADRAAAVKNYLTLKGAKNNMRSDGLGSSSPITENETEQGRSRNRRVEFVITKQ